ncbi:methyl-accepting chemotaxis protein [Calothrix rhizosoleniae]|uniref:methyl-accepting chemotaxis protein n=1 Tax=Calothrix rhizosoleniae TaxID=888997 RepID=UPI000B4A0F77|nr:methyl-accepting chemotaxis protein [Calothrix rhizosoleniae]
MALSIDNYQEMYQQAYKAYVQANYEEAANLIDKLVDIAPEDANIHLLRGHIYYVLQQFDVAQSEYESVIELTEEQELIGLAQNSLDNINQYQQQLAANSDSYTDQDESMDFSPIDEEAISIDNIKDLVSKENITSNTLNLNNDNFSQELGVISDDLPVGSPFELAVDSNGLMTTSNSSQMSDDNPFALQNQFPKDKSSELNGSHPWQQDNPANNVEAPEDQNSPFTNNNNSQPFSDSEDEFSSESDQLQSPGTKILGDHGNNNLAGETLLMGVGSPINNIENYHNNFSQLESENQQSHSQKLSQENNLDSGDDSFDFEAFESAFGSEDPNESEDVSSIPSSSLPQSGNIEFLDDFDEFDDLGDIPGFNIPETAGNQAFSTSGSLENPTGNHNILDTSTTSQDSNSDRDDELFSITGSQEGVPVFTDPGLKKIEPEVNVEQGFFAPLENASLKTKPWLIGGAVGIVSAIVVASVSFAATSFSPENQRESVRNTGWAMALAAGITGTVTTGIASSLSIRQLRRTTRDLQSQFDAVRQGNLNVKATVYSEDEFGQLATGFNEMARVIFTTTNEATRKAEEQEEAKENLQRQVIRLLDDVEGAARGDLTVQAEVTADVLGAVADAFNLTIQNLRDIVQQVKVAAREVTKGSTNSETFARALSSDALRQAEELAATLNSVQVMTDSIQRVAEAAREAEAVTHDASEIAQKGGEAVENTVAGILEIRETVAESTRKVKRLAESSQEISKIVALISQIASRTNLLALNASIEAARAGEAGRGFAIVADEVRQLADKSAKSLKEIEQIVMQIQSETGSVMTAMEEGTQQVIKGTKLAEEAKRSLDNIIHVADHIDKLVRSISADTVNQTDTSRAVAQVMQSVELTAQETSQEAQRVSGALQHLVGVSRDLISSVERFRVETSESR